MGTFKIEIQEVLAKIVEIEADNAEMAMELAKDMYHDEVIVLNDSDHVDTEFRLPD